MLLKEVEFHGFKSIISDKLEINDNQICLVGINESGKTNYLKAINFLNLADVVFEKGMISKLLSNYRDTTPLVSGIFELSDQDVVWMDKVVNNSEISTLNKRDKFYLQVKRWGSYPDNIAIQLFRGGLQWNVLEQISNKAEFLDKFITEIYPEILFFTSQEDLLIEPATVDDLLSADNKYETLRRLFYVCGIKNLEVFKDANHDDLTIAIDEANENLRNIFHHHYKQDNSIEVVIKLEGERFNVIIKDSSRKPFTIRERAPGFQYYFAFLINKLYTSEVHDQKAIIYLLDEPGINLHPKGARNLLDTFKGIAVKDQIIYSTHNPFLTLRNNPSALIYISKDGKKGSKISKKPWKNNYQILRKELGILLNDSFLLGDLNLVVEGTTEKFILHKLFQDDVSGELEWVNIYDSESASKIPQVVNYLGVNCLNLTGLILVDGDKPGEDVLKHKSVRKNLETSKWFLLSINDIFKTKIDRTFEDLFSPSVYMSAYNTYCEKYGESLELISFQKLQKIPKDSGKSFIKNIEEHFDAQQKQENSDVTFANSVIKLEIAQIALDMIYSLEEKERNRELENFYKLLSLIKESARKITVHANN